MRQYHDLLRLVLEQGKPRRIAPAPARIRFSARRRAFDLRRAFPAAHDEKAPSQIDHLRAALVSARRHERQLSRTNTASRSGTNGRTRTAISAAFMARNGATGAAPTARSINQIDDVIEQIKKNPDSRRLIVSAWNVGEIEQDGAAAVPRAVSVLRAGRRTELPALPAQRRSCFSACRSTSPATRCSR